MANQDGERFASRHLADLLRSDIEAGVKYPPGTPLPSYRRLVADHGVAINTAQAAVRLLASEGLVEIKPSSGAYVRDLSDLPPNEGDVRAELAEVRERLHRARQDLGEAEQTVADLLARLPTEPPRA